MKRVVIVGMGLIGGSIGLALKQSLSQIELVGVDREQVLEAAPVRALLNQSVTSESIDLSRMRSLDADLFVLAVPVRTISETVGSWLDAGAPVTDCGSTKQVIVASAEQSAARHWFVPGHPMAGREKGGFASASADLFRSKSWIICPQKSSAAALMAVRDLVSAVGAKWTEMSPEAHDLAVALTSHLPQLIASWLAAKCDESQRPAAGPAFSDMTRVAGGSEAIWRDIFETNALPVARVARNLAGDLVAIAEALERSNPSLDGVLRLLASARRT